MAALLAFPLLRRLDAFTVTPDALMRCAPEFEFQFIFRRAPPADDASLTLGRQFTHLLSAEFIRLHDDATAPILISRRCVE